MRVVAAVLLSLILPACGLLDEPAPTEDMTIAAHAADTYVWPERKPCRAWDCEGETFPVRIEEAESSDTEVVDAWVDAGIVQLRTDRPGFAVVRVYGEGRARALRILVEPVAAMEFTERRVVEDDVLMLPNATTALDLALYDIYGEPLAGAPELDLTATAGAVAESMTDRSAIAVTAPAALGRFEITLDGVGTILTGEVIEEGDIDGLVSTTEFVAPTIGDRILAAGPVHAEFVRSSSAPCTIDAHEWGGVPGEPQGEVETWFVSATVDATGEPCDLRVSLPLANGGEGLTRAIDG